MKKLRVFLMVLAAPAAVLLGMRELGGTPISKGYDTGFEWRAESNGRLIRVSLEWLRKLAVPFPLSSTGRLPAR
jgi:hypothetical protein